MASRVAITYLNKIILQAQHSLNNYIYPALQPLEFMPSTKIKRTAADSTILFNVRAALL